MERYYNYVLRTPIRPSPPEAWGFDLSRMRRFGAPIGRIPASHFMLTEEFKLLAGDEFPVLNTWPDLWKAIMFEPHKDRRQRYRLFVFLYSNGMMAHHAVYWTMWHGGYDRSAWGSIVDAANDTLTVDGRRRLAQCPVFNFELGRVD